MNDETKTSCSCHEIVAWVLTATGLLFILQFRLLPALLAGLLVYELVDLLVPMMRVGRFTQDRAKIVVVAVLSVFIVTILSLIVIGLINFFRSGSESLPVLLTKMAEIIDSSKTMLPGWLVENLPTDAEELKAQFVDWLKEHASGVTEAGETLSRIIIYVIFGMIIGAIISLNEAKPVQTHKPLADALIDRITRLSKSFRRIVFAQVRIAGLNALFTGLYLAVVLPLLGVNLPLTKTLIVVTFVTGLLPVVGNLISNTIIVIVSLSQSLPVAIGSLAFLILIHKLEYFLNAKIIGTQIRAKAWELLVAMMVMEVVFGIAGVIAAPIYYAYLKDELTKRELI